VAEAQLPAACVGHGEAALFAGLQRTIEHLHDVKLALDVHQYLVDDALRCSIPGARPGIPEQLFVYEEPEAVELALYVDRTVIAQLRQDDPHVRLHSGNWESYCIALEGVSHFVLVAWRYSAGWSTTALEMELQADVDKFVASWLLLRAQGPYAERSLSALLKQLFCHYALRESVPSEEQERYHTASRCAEAFCRRLVKRHGERFEMGALLQDVRSFSRQSLQQKLV
jgi:hypothetical protein